MRLSGFSFFYSLVLVAHGTKLYFHNKNCEQRSKCEHFWMECRQCICCGYCYVNKLMLPIWTYGFYFYFYQINTYNIYIIGQLCQIDFSHINFHHLIVGKYFNKLIGIQLWILSSFCMPIGWFSLSILFNNVKVVQ